MRFNILSEVGRGRKALEFNKAWHSKFAWFPFRIDGNTIVWLERYMRRKPVSSGWVYKTRDKHIMDKLAGVDKTDAQLLREEVGIYRNT